MRRTLTTLACLAALTFLVPAATFAQTGAVAPSDLPSTPTATPAAAPAATPTAMPVATPPTAPTGTDTAAPTAFQPYKGRINVDIVNLRCGPGLYFYPLTTLSQDAPVSVEGQTDEWLALKPTADVCGLVRKSDVTSAAGTSAATVSAPSPRVYASSKTATRRWCVMKTLSQGDKVKVLGPVGDDWLRIAPPEGSYIYILAKYVSSSTTAPPTSGNAATPGPESDYSAVLNTEVKQPSPDYALVKALDDALATEMEKPVEQRDYKSLMDQYRDLSTKVTEDYIKRATLTRLDRLEALTAQQAEYVKMQKLHEDLDSDLAKIEAHRAEEATAAQEAPKGKPAFAATGVVAPIESLEGVDHPVKFKLIGKDGRPVVVLQSNTYNLADYVGKAVGVRGTKTYYKEWSIYLVTVDDLELLE